MRTRSFHPVMILITFMLMLFGLASGCVSDPVTTNQVTETDSGGITATDSATAITIDRQAELIALVQEWIETQDDSLVQQIQNEEELRFVEDLLQQWQSETDTSGANTDPPPPPMAGCSGYWGTQAALSNPITFAAYKWSNSSYSYYWSPNCAMAAPGDDCGTDHNDYMVSFWMGPDYTTDEASYRVDSDTWSTYWNLLYHGGASYRVYTSNAYGPTYGNAYVCLSNSLDASTLRFGRDY